MDAAGLEPTTVTESTCCHADKLETWVDGPDGTHWEWYLKVADVEPTTTEGAAPVSDLQPGHGPPTLPASLLPVAPTPGDGCMLDAADLPARLRQASRLAAHLRGVRRDDLQVVLTVDADGRSDVDDFVRAESQCCAMFDFHVYGTDDRILLAISAPPTSRHLLDELHGVLSDLQRAAPG